MSVLVNFVEYTNDFKENTVKEYTYKSIHSALKGLASLADKRYGKGNWIMKPDTTLIGGYAVADTGECLEAVVNH